MEPQSETITSQISNSTHSIHNYYEQTIFIKSGIFLSLNPSLDVSEIEFMFLVSCE